MQNVKAPANCDVTSSNKENQEIILQELEYIPDSGMEGYIHFNEDGLCDTCKPLGYCKLKHNQNE